MKIIPGTLFVFLLLTSTPVSAESAKANVSLATPNGLEDRIGTVSFHDSAKGLQIVTRLKNLPPGIHGFHVHEKGSCDAAMKDGSLVPAQAAGGHFDPLNSGKHEGPTGHGHEGDMPTLTVAADGSASDTIYAPRLTVKDILNRSVVIHEGSDNYSDTPQPLGGGGKRIACGVIKKD